MSFRYFVETPISPPRAILRAAEAHHLAHVMRGHPGTEVVLFDGSGAEFLARVQSIIRSEVQLTVLGRREVDRELPQRITLGVALPKTDRRRWLVEKLVELGVAKMVPLETVRVDRPSRQPSGGRMRRTVIEASKQCGRNRLMEIAPTSPFTEYLAAAPDASRRLVAHPNRVPHPAPGPTASLEGRVSNESGSRSAGGEEVYLAIGPEGGFTDEEMAAARRIGWQRVDLGPRILRTETAAVALVAAIALRA